MKRVTPTLIAAALLYASAPAAATPAPQMQIAFMPDIHFHDVYGQFKDGSFKGLLNHKSGQYATIRTMQAELTSTRLFNENYFALLAALDDAAKRGIKYIALPGDFSDDGQSLHLRGLRTILNRYSKQYGLQFFATPGNHDPNRPFSRASGKSDFLGPGGKTQRIFSKGAQECQGYKGKSAIIKAGFELPTRCSEEVKELGYSGIVKEMADFGFFPKASDRYWETPYSTYTQNNYSYSRAKQQSPLSKRQYEICRQGTGGRYKQKGYSDCFMVPDTSYLVEPTQGLWLLAVDANVYLPQDDANAKHPKAAANFEGSGNAGYNRMLTHKRQVIDWMKDVAARAKAQGKQLVTFSHFPMTDFYDGAATSIAKTFGDNAFQLARLPQLNTSKALAETGIKLHVGGHMHFNDTGFVRNRDGSFLFNIQAPSMAAYVPAYKLLTFKSSEKVEVQTVVLKKVPRFNELFEHYDLEWQHLNAIHAPNIWNREVLSAKSYGELTRWHMTELTRLRFLPQEWPCALKQMVFALNGRQMLILSQLQTTLSLNQILHPQSATPSSGTCTLDVKPFNPQGIKGADFASAWQTATEKARELARHHGMTLEAFERWDGFDFAVDFYRLRNADALALRDIIPSRLAQYSLLAKSLAKRPQETELKKTSFESQFTQRFSSVLSIFDKFAHALPSEYFILDLKQGTLTDLQSKINK